MRDSFRFSAGGVDVLAPRINYADGMPLIAWREHDRHAPYSVHRLHLLRTVLQTGKPSKLLRARLMASDAVIRFKVLITILRLAQRNRYEAVCLGELLASGWLIRLLQKLTDMRVIVYVHGEEITTYNRLDPLKRRCMGLLRNADGIVVVSRFTQSVMLDLLGPGIAAKMTLIQNGVASGLFTPGPKRPDLLARYRLEDAFVFVSICRLLEKKGVDNALRAFAAVISGHGGSLANSRFLIVGTGPYEATLMTLAGQLCIADRVVFAGSVAEADLVDLYRLGDVFVMPNRQLPDGDTEGFGLVFLEANGCGIPVIAGSDGGSTDAVLHQVNGLVVNGHSVPDIANAMTLLHDNAALRARLRQSGLEHARSVDWAEKARMFLNFCLNRDG